MNVEAFREEVKRANNWGIDPQIPYESVYKVVNNYVKPFDTEGQAKRSAKKAGVPVEEILNQWEFARKWGSAKGIVVHNYIADALGFPQKDDDALYDFLSMLDADQFSEFQTYIKNLENQAAEFLQENGHLEPVRTEFWLCDPEHGVRGVADQLMYNKKNDQLELYDWKTNKNFRFKPYNKWNPEMFLGSLSYLPKTDANFYGLQLNIYRSILEKYSILKVNACKIVWFNENNKKALTIGLPKMETEVQTILKERKNLIEHD